MSNVARDYDENMRFFCLFLQNTQIGLSDNMPRNRFLVPLSRHSKNVLFLVLRFINTAASVPAV